jgi:virginiamycin B lyase
MAVTRGTSLVSRRRAQPWSLPKALLANSRCKSSRSKKSSSLTISVNDRIGDGQLMYQMLQTDQWQIADTCPKLIEAIPSRMHDEKRPGDVLKVPGDPLHDVADDVREGIYTFIATITKDYNFLRRRTSLSLRKLCLFTLAASLAGSTTVETLNVQIQEYEVPTPKSRPHDPARAPDGSLWYTGQGANKLGRLDPKTGEFKEYPLKRPNSGPHGLVADKDGNIWFTAISGGYVGKLNPKTGEIVEYRPADGAEIDPHTPVFDQNGILWFTNQETNYIGRLDPKTGKMILTKSPTPHAVPYGIVILQNNTPFFCEFGTNKLASIDPSTMRIREYTLPAASARPRRIALAPDGTIYYTDFARGYLGHFDPSGETLLKEWLSPGGSESEPYGIAITNNGEVWYSESGVKPNTLVRFDPKAESFSTKPIPSGGGVVRNMVATPDRRLYLACSGVNKVAVVDLNR